MESNSPLATVKKAVEEVSWIIDGYLRNSNPSWFYQWINNLCCSASPFLCEFLRYIEEHMVIVSLQKRHKSDEVLKKLKDMYRHCREDPLFCSPWPLNDRQNFFGETKKAIEEDQLTLFLKWACQRFTPTLLMCQIPTQRRASMETRWAQKRQVPRTATRTCLSLPGSVMKADVPIDIVNFRLVHKALVGASWYNVPFQTHVRQQPCHA